jgi:hypothetical protein
MAIKKVKKQLVPRTRNGGTETESGHLGKIRAALRKITMYSWIPIRQAKENARRKYVGASKKQKWEYQCAHCKTWHMEKNIECDHIVEAGTLKSYADLPAFCERLFCEDVNNYQMLCHDCHVIKTNKNRELNKI